MRGWRDSIPACYISSTAVASWYRICWLTGWLGMSCWCSRSTSGLLAIFSMTFQHEWTVSGKEKVMPIEVASGCRLNLNELLMQFFSPPLASACWLWTTILCGILCPVLLATVINLLLITAMGVLELSRDACNLTKALKPFSTAVPS